MERVLLFFKGMDDLPKKACRAGLPFGLKRRKKEAFTIIQVMVAAGIVTFCGLIGVQSLMIMNRRAASIRLMNNARAILEQNLQTALNIPFSDASVPGILAVTTSAPSPTAIALATKPDGTTQIGANLWRIVSAESTSPTIRRVTFTVAYNYANLPKTFKGPDNALYTAGFSFTTLRTTD